MAIKTHPYYVVVGTIDGNEEVLYGSYDKSDTVYEKEAEKESWKSDGYTKIKIKTIQKEEAPDPEVYGDDIASRIIVDAISDGCEVTVFCEGEEQNEDKASFADVIDTIGGIDGICSVELHKDGEYIGQMAVCLDNDMSPDETTIDYTMKNDYLDKLWHKHWAKYQQEGE